MLLLVSPSNLKIFKPTLVRSSVRVFLTVSVMTPPPLNTELMFLLKSREVISLHNERLRVVLQSFNLAATTKSVNNV